jgi:hypothetical protein
MVWTAVFHEEFEGEFDGLKTIVQDELLAKMMLLEGFKSFYYLHNNLLQLITGSKVAAVECKRPNNKSTRIFLCDGFPFFR